MENIDAIYCDFDGTITKKDMVNTFLELYAGEKWKQSEQDWINGKINSLENMTYQVSLVKKMSEKTLNSFIDSIEIDEYFTDFVKYVHEKNINLTILSDGLDLFIEKILYKYNIKNVPFYANHLVYKDGYFKVEFPYNNSNCNINAGMCKCSKIKEKKFCYIGDGTTDLCVAKKASVLFAKARLEDYCTKNSIEHYPFYAFNNIIDVLNN